MKPRPDTSQRRELLHAAVQHGVAASTSSTGQRFFRDGRTTDLGHAFTEPWIEDNQQLGTTRAAAAATALAILRAHPGYVARFQRALGRTSGTIADEAVFDLAGQALAVFARQLVTRASPVRPLERRPRQDPRDAGGGRRALRRRGGCIALPRRRRTSPTASSTT